VRNVLRKRSRVSIVEERWTSMKKFDSEIIREIEKIYGKSSESEIEQAEILLNNPHLLQVYMEENHGDQDVSSNCRRDKNV
jgi:hypothetical protein